MASHLSGFPPKVFAADRTATLQLSRNQCGLHHNLPVALPLNMAPPALALLAACASAREVVGTASLQEETSGTAFEIISYGSSLICNARSAPKK